MKTPHKHATLIKAWAEGATIQYFSCNNKWEDCVMNRPGWDEGTTYRIKPEPRPDVVSYTRVGGFALGIFRLETDDLKLTFDGETGKLKAAEVIA